ncbi:hypothetical protein FB451DRAFT_1181346 [Mycena latifolia]|nr:hypothetical protein FB451DRAFT_1181346 [Mycena latifolia]
MLSVPFILLVLAALGTQPPAPDRHRVALAPHEWRRRDTQRLAHGRRHRRRLVEHNRARDSGGSTTLTIGVAYALEGEDAVGNAIYTVTSESAQLAALGSWVLDLPALSTGSQPMGASTTSSPQPTGDANSARQAASLAEMWCGSTCNLTALSYRLGMANGLLQPNVANQVHQRAFESPIETKLPVNIPGLK